MVKPILIHKWLNLNQIYSVKPQGWQPPKPQTQINIQPDTTLQIELTQSQDDLESTKQRVEQDQQKKLQHRQEIDQGLAKLMSDNLQQQIHRLGGRS